MNNAESSFYKLTCLIDNIHEEFFDVKVTAVYLRKETMDWILSIKSAESWAFAAGGIEVHKTKSGNEVVTMRPYGIGEKIPVKGKYSGHGPWKVVLAPKTFEGGEP